jgi:hypothetical protein
MKCDVLVGEPGRGFENSGFFNQDGNNVVRLDNV